MRLALTAIAWACSGLPAQDTSPEAAPRALRLPRADPTAHGMAAGLQAELEGTLREAIAARAFSGAVVQVSRRGVVVAEAAAGRHDYADDSPRVRLDTPFDLASLTKVCATAPAVLRLAARGTIDLDGRVADLLPAFRGVGKERVTLRHLLTHSAGLPAHVTYHRSLSGKDAIVAAAAAEGLAGEPGGAAVYSDVGFILLMACAEAAAAVPFTELVEREVFAPLGMVGARFVRAEDPPLLAPATEDDPRRGGVVRGRVHDENAFAMGGVSGHAGMFATADDVTKLGCAFLAGGNGWLPAPVARAAVARAEVVAGSSRALGFDTFVEGGPAGSLLSAAAFGHTGFTGTSLWCDPATDVCVVLLTNRVHPTRANARIGAVRRRVHDAVARAIEGWTSR
jgi:CubicO group peptidase (beta-lactamase class C family)